MRIAIGLINLEAGGTEFQMCLLADGLRDRGHDIFFYLIDGGQDEAMLSQFAPFPTRVALPRSPYFPIQFWESVWHWRRWLKVDAIDLAIGGLSLPHAVLGMAVRGLAIRLIGRRGFPWHDVDHLPAYRRIGRFQRAYRRLTERRTEAVVCNAHHVATSVRLYEGWPTEKLHVIRNGWPEQEAIDWTPTSVWYAAKPRDEKGHSAFAYHASRWGLIPSLCFGIPRWEEVGIYLHPSLAEGCSNSIGMAMAHAIPVVAFGLAGNLELMRELPTVEPFEYEGLCKAVQTLRGDRGLRASLGLRGQQLVREHFSLDRMVHQWDSLCRQIHSGAS